VYKDFNNYSVWKEIISVKLYVLKLRALSLNVSSTTPHVPGAEPAGNVTVEVYSYQSKSSADG